MYLRAFQELGFTGFMPIENLQGQQGLDQYLKNNESRDNLLLISSGRYSTDLIKMVLEHNKDYKRVQAVIIFTSNFEMNQHFLTDYPDLVMAVTDEFSDLTEKFNYTIKKIEFNSSRSTQVRKVSVKKSVNFSSIDESEFLRIIEVDSEIDSN